MALMHTIFTTSAKLDSIIKTKGNIIFVQDTKEIYIDFDSESRVQVGLDNIPFPDKLPADGGDAATVNGFTVQSAVPANAKFTDTTYSNKDAVSGGTDVSLVTTGEKAIWNNKINKEDIIVSNVDIGEGAPLESGKFYFVYE